MRASEQDRGIVWKRLVPVTLRAILTGAQSARPENYRRTGTSSGTWKVRVVKRENPGKNAWGDSTENVHVRTDGKLRLGLRTDPVGRSVELAAVRPAQRVLAAIPAVVLRADRDDVDRRVAVRALDRHGSHHAHSENSLARSAHNEELGIVATLASVEAQTMSPNRLARRANNSQTMAARNCFAHTDLMPAAKMLRARRLWWSAVPGYVTGRFMAPYISYWLCRGTRWTPLAGKNAIHPTITATCFRSPRS
jgi:hypothetical protein